MSYTAYIAPSDLLETSPPRGGSWHATVAIADRAQSLIVVEWDNSNALAEFEAQSGVVRLGLPWETIPGEALSLLSVFQDEVVLADTGSSVAIPGVDTTPLPTASTPVSAALRQINWPGARLVR